MRSIVFYFSGTGNTRWAAETFCRLAAGNGHQARAVSTEDAACAGSDTLAGLLAGCDTIGIAYPVYGADLPPAMQTFLPRLAPALRVPLPAFVIATVGFINACGPVRAGRILHRHGLSMRGHVNLRIANNTSVPGMRTAIPAPARLARRLARGETRLAALLDALVAGRRHIRGRIPAQVPGILIRRLAADGIRRCHETLGIDPARCVRCLRCVRRCPGRAIEDRDGRLVPTDRCLACFRCFNECPAHAVTHKGHWADPARYPRWTGPPA